MQPGALYEEKITSKWMTAILIPVTGIMLFLLGYQVLIGPLGTPPAPTWFYLIMALLFLGVTLNFSKVIIRMTPSSIAVGYGIFKHTILWENIEGCFLDETSAVKYGGSGIRVTKVGGKSRIVYSVVGGPRVVLSLKEGRYKELAFSTNHPQEVMKLVKEWTHTK